MAKSKLIQDDFDAIKQRGWEKGHILRTFMHADDSSKKNAKYRVCCESCGCMAFVTQKPDEKGERIWGDALKRVCSESSKLFRTWARRFETARRCGYISKGEIAALRGIFGSYRRDSMYGYEREEIGRNVNYPMLEQFGITPDHTAQGKDFLERNRKYLSESAASILDRFKKFTFAGITTVTNPYSNRPASGVVFRVHAKNGDYFDYTYLPWQAIAYGDKKMKPLHVLTVHRR